MRKYRIVLIGWLLVIGIIIFFTNKSFAEENVLAQRFALIEAVNYGEPVKFGKSIYFISNSEGLEATQVVLR